MARIERYTSTEEVPVERAQLIHPHAFPFSYQSAETLKQIGGVLEELGRRKLAAEDSLAINAAGESRDLAKLQMQQFMLDNPDPAKWSEGLQKIISDQRRVFAGQKFSAHARANEDIEQQAFEDEFIARVEIASTTQTIENDIFVSGKNLISVIANDDGSTTAAADIDKQIKLYQAALERKYPKEVADIQMEETLLQAEKQKSQVRIDTIYETAKTMPYAEAITYINDFKGITEAERNAIIKRRERQNEIETATTNRKVRWDVLRKLGKDPDSVTDEYLEGLVKPNSLTWDDAEEFKKIRDTKNHPLTSPRAQIYFGELDRLYKDGALDTLEYDIKNEKLTEFFEANPDATAKQVNEFYNELVGEEKEHWVWWLLNKAYTSGEALGDFLTTGGISAAGAIYRKKKGEKEPITRTDSKGQVWEYIGDNKWRKKK